MIPINYIIKELLAEKTRLFLTIFAIAWGTASITIMLAVGEGLRLNFGTAMSGAGESILAVQGGETTQMYQGQGINQAVLLTEQDLNAVQKSLTEVEVTAEYSFSAELKTAEKQQSSSVNAVYPDYQALRNITIKPGGRFINELDNSKQRHVIVLGKQLADAIFSDVDDPVGQILQVENIPFTVIGVTAPKIQLWGYQMTDDYLAWIPAQTYKGLAAPNFITYMIVRLNDPAENELIQTQIRKIIAFNHHLSPKDDNIISVRDSIAVQEKTNLLFSGMQIFLGLIGSLTLIVAGVGVSNVMFVSVRRNIKEIGVRMAIGARSWQVLIHYVVEGLLASFAGGFLGLVVAWGVTKLIGLIPMNQPFFQQVGQPRPVLSITVVMIVIGLLGLIGFLAGFFPARKASQINPVEALRQG